MFATWRSSDPLPVVETSNSLIRALEAETSVPLKVSTPATPTLVSVVEQSVPLQVFSVICRLPSAVVEMPLPVLLIRSLPKIPSTLLKSCSPPVIAPPESRKAPVTKN